MRMPGCRAKRTAPTTPDQLRSTPNGFTLHLPWIPAFAGMTESFFTEFLDVLSQPDAVPLPHVARSLRTRIPPRRMRAQAGRRAGDLLARFRVPLRPRRRGAV